MSSFAKAVEKVSNKTLTENGAVVEAITGSPVLDFSHKVVRSTKPDEIKSRISEIMTHINRTGDIKALTDLFVLMFHKRNPRGGEGEKEMVYNMFLELYEYYPKTVTMLIRFLGDFGYFKDLFQIWEKVWKIVNTEISNKTGEEKNKSIMFYTNKYSPLINEIVTFVIHQRNVDLKTLSEEGNSISLVGKYIPCQKGHFAKNVFWYVKDNYGILTKKRCTEMLVHQLASQSGIKLNYGLKVPSFWFQKYRVGNTLLNKKLNVPEIAMCAGSYSSLKYEQISAKAMLRYRKAFLNEKLKEIPKGYEEETGNRHPENKDRILARSNLKEILSGKASEKLKTAGLEPHDILEKVIKKISTSERDALFSLWEAKKLDVQKHFTEVLKNLKDIGQDLGDFPRPGKVIPMVDVSESMATGSPSAIEVAIALGIMTSELHPADSPFRDTLISFTDIPTVFKFKTTQNLIDRYNVISKHKGYNTNFALAMEELLSMCIKNKVAEEDIPDLLVFTDGQFDIWGSKYNNMAPGKYQWVTHHEHLMKMWSASGYTKIPRIIFWNLRGGTPGVQTSANHPGVQMLQGFSPNLIKFVLYGESFGEKTQEIEVNGKVVTMKVSSVTPWDTFRTIIDQSKYDIIRVALDASNEKLLSEYRCSYPDITLLETPLEKPELATATVTTQKEIEKPNVTHDASETLVETSIVKKVEDEYEVI